MRCTSRTTANRNVDVAVDEPPEPEPGCAVRLARQRIETTWETSSAALLLLLRCTSRTTANRNGSERRRQTEPATSWLRCTSRTTANRSSGPDARRPARRAALRCTSRTTANRNGSYPRHRSGRAVELRCTSRTTANRNVACVSSNTPCSRCAVRLARQRIETTRPRAG